jgi:hypothetical protein
MLLCVLGPRTIPRFRPYFALHILPFGPLSKRTLQYYCHYYYRGRMFKKLAWCRALITLVVFTLAQMNIGGEMTSCHLHMTYSNHS